MNVSDFLKKVAYIGKSEIADDDGEIYYSNFDKSYITRVEMAKDDGLLKFMAEHEITDELTHGVGFSPKENKWYGWSHRAIFGFEIGSTCKKGDCHYKGSTLAEQEEAAINFWKDECYDNVHSKGFSNRGDYEVFEIVWTYNDKTPNKALVGTQGGSIVHVDKLGRGEWVAKTMKDAKEMAIDFNESVS